MDRGRGSIGSDRSWIVALVDRSDRSWIVALVDQVVLGSWPRSIRSCMDRGPGRSRSCMDHGLGDPGRAWIVARVKKNFFSKRPNFVLSSLQFSLCHKIATPLVSPPPHVIFIIFGIFSNYLSTKKKKKSKRPNFFLSSP